jgi:hypothetical protein
MIKIKHSKYTLVTVGAIVVVVGLAVCLYYKHHSSAKAANVTVSNEKTFISAQNLFDNPSAGIPHGTKHQVAAGMGVSWIEESVVDGNDTCFLFDETSHQIYALESKSSGYTPDGSITEAQRTYYNNDKISKINAIKLLNNSCYK